MKQTIHVSIDSNGRAKASSKNLGNQYETGVAEFEIDLSADWQDDSYFYYLVVIPPESTGIKQYAVPLTKEFIYLISSNITWHLGTFKFLIIVMNKALPESGEIPTDGVVSISDEWEGEVNKSSLKLAELKEQPENPNFTLLYTDLMALRNSVEAKGNYAQTQGDYAKSVGEALTEDKNNGNFNGKDGISPIVNVIKENKVTKITFIDADKTETVEVNDGEDGKSAGFGTPVVEVETLEAGSTAKATITASGEDAEKVFKFIFGIPRGENGDKGEPGRGVVSIIRTSGTGAPGTYDTYTITYSDNTTSSFQVYNGKDGTGGGTSGNVPTKLSELTNDTGFITNTANNLVNYYLKSESYNKDEINTLIGGLSSLSAIVVTELPTENISTSTIYLIANTSQTTNNYYDEYLYINNTWEKIGTTQVNLENFYTIEEINNLLKTKISEPATEGIANQILVTDGAGNRTWKSLASIVGDNNFHCVDLISERLTSAGNYTLNDSILNYDEITVVADLAASSAIIGNRDTTVTIVPSTLEFPTSTVKYILHIADTKASTWNSMACEVLFGFNSDTELVINRTVLGTAVTDRTYGISHVYGKKYISATIAETLGGAY